MQITQWARPGLCSNRLHHGSTAMACHPGRAMACQTVLYTHSRAAKRPLAASLPATPSLSYRGCLIVFTVFRVAANDPEMFSLRCMFSRFCTPSHTLPRKGLQQPNNGGVTHFPHVHQQCWQDTLSTNPRIPPIHQDQHFH